MKIRGISLLKGVDTSQSGALITHTTCSEDASKTNFPDYETDVLIITTEPERTAGISQEPLDTAAKTETALKLVLILLMLIPAMSYQVYSIHSCP